MLGNVYSEVASGRRPFCSCSLGDGLDLTSRQLLIAISALVAFGGESLRAQGLQTLFGKEVLFLWSAVAALRSAWRCPLSLVVLDQALVHKPALR